MRIAAGYHVCHRECQCHDLWGHVDKRIVILFLSDPPSVVVSRGAAGFDH